MSAPEIKIRQQRRWEVVIDRNGADWPNIPHTGRRPGLLVKWLTFWVDIKDGGHLWEAGLTAHGVNIRKDGSLGARAERWLWLDPPAWVMPLIAEALEQIAATPWPEPVAGAR